MAVFFGIRKATLCLENAEKCLKTLLNEFCKFYCFFLNFTNFKMKDQIDQKSTNFKKADMKS